MHFYKEAEDREHGSLAFPFAFYDTDESNPRYQMISHWHMQWEMIYIAKGRLALNIDGTDVLATAGDIVLIAGGKIHTGTATDALYYCLLFDMSKLFLDKPVFSAELDHIIKGVYEIPYLLTDTPAAPVCLNLINLFYKPAKGYELLVMGMLYTVMGTIIQYKMYAVVEKFAKKNKMNERMLEVLQLISREYMEDLTLYDMCSLVHIEKKYFCKCFKKITGKSYVSYLNHYRIQKACEQLMSASDTIVDIAYACGFKDVSYFNRVFRQIKNCTPKEYRRFFQN